MHFFHTQGNTQVCTRAQEEGEHAQGSSMVSSFRRMRRRRQKNVYIA